MVVAVVGSEGEGLIFYSVVRSCHSSESNEAASQIRHMQPYIAA